MEILLSSDFRPGEEPAARGSAQAGEQRTLRERHLARPNNACVTLHPDTATPGTAMAS